MTEILPVFLLFGLGEDEAGRMLYLVALLLLVSAGLVGYRGRWPKALSHIGIWIVVIIALVAIYAYRQPLLQVAAPIISELSPGRAIMVTAPDGARNLTVSRASDGHFHVRGDVNGVGVDFLVDSGASVTTLAWHDAERAGLAVDGLRFDRLVQTASGTALSARARLDRLAIGPYVLSDVSISVMPRGTLSTSLLGMNVLNSFASWRVEGDRLVLTALPEA
ncbi:MAG TPA: TIGR02281 family clan AA aspartic protease [Afifellaceae bacterium]|nr:TIGR02281 family clan AA aspartic protease [Afifellaceae bacterium]